MSASRAELAPYRDRLAIVGSGTFRTPGGEQFAARTIQQLFAARRPDLVISGRCPRGGVDMLAEQAAAELGIPFLARAATVERWAGPGGFRERNQRIAQDCTRLLCIRCAYSRTYGSGWTRDRAAERLAPENVRSYTVDERGVHLEPKATPRPPGP